MRSILGAALDEHADVTVVDMEAGLEHLSRSGGTLAHVDALCVVMEPTRKAVLTAARTLDLARELGIPVVYGIGNKVRDADDETFLREACDKEGLTLLGIVPHDEDIAEADRRGEPIGPGQASGLRETINAVADLLSAPETERVALLRAREEIDKRLAAIESDA